MFIGKFEKKLEEINISKLGAEKYLKKLCELGLEFNPGGPSDLMRAFVFWERLCGRIAEVIGVDTDTDFQKEDFQHFINLLEGGATVSMILEGFTTVV